MLDPDDPIAKREKMEAEAFLHSSADNLGLSKPSEAKKESKNEVMDLLSVLDTVDTKLKKKYKE